MLASISGARNVGSFWAGSMMDKLTFCARKNSPREQHQAASLGLRPEELGGIGISCGGPINSQTGRILSPPNLPLCKDVSITDYFEKTFYIRARLQNDANACVVAEWKFGAVHKERKTWCF